MIFNEQQRQLIEDLLYKSPDRKIADVLDESRMDRGEVLFVKALEQVQGDERDVIIFSIAFSKQANGKIPTNFGPLSNSGGERRLNVAITRARRKNIVFCSFEPGELDVSGSTFDGPKHLKEFLTFARNAGGFDGAGDPAQRAGVRDRHRDDIASALRDAGLHVRSDVGLSNFRLDLVLARADNPDRPILPVLLDGESWRQRTTVSDRDVLPVEVLEGLMGWPKVARIWWPMWLQNRDEVLRRVLEEVEQAEQVLDGEPAAAADALPESPTDHDPALIASAEGAPGSTDVAPLLPVDPPVPPVTPTLESPPPEPSAVEPPPPTEAVLPVVESPSPVVTTEAPSPGPTAPVEAPAGASVPKAGPPDIGAVSVFRPAHTNVVGTRTVLDALPDRAAAAAVHEQLLDVIEAEGPVELSRLTRLVARRFGLHTVRASRADDIARLVPRGHLRKSKLGSFAWPTYLDPETWRGYRTVDPDSTRTLDEVAPEEIANAMSAVTARAPDAEDEVILRSTAEAFGIVRLGANVRTRLHAVNAKFFEPNEPHPATSGEPAVEDSASSPEPAAAPSTTPTLLTPSSPTDLSQQGDIPEGADHPQPGAQPASPGAEPVLIAEPSGPALWDGTALSVGDWVHARRGGGGDRGYVVAWPDQVDYPNWVRIQLSTGDQKVVHTRGPNNESGLVRSTRPEDWGTISAVDQPTSYAVMRLADGDPARPGQIVRHRFTGATGLLVGLTPNGGNSRVTFPGSNAGEWKQFRIGTLHLVEDVAQGAHPDHDRPGASPA